MGIGGSLAGDMTTNGQSRDGTAIDGQIRGHERTVPVCAKHSPNIIGKRFILRFGLFVIYRGFRRCQAYDGSLRDTEVENSVQCCYLCYMTTRGFQIYIGGVWEGRGVCGIVMAKSKRRRDLRDVATARTGKRHSP